MSEFRTQTTYADEASGLRSYITGVFTRMGIAVLITCGSVSRLLQHCNPGIHV